MLASVGRLVHYTLTEDDAEQVNRRRKDAANNVGKIREDALGYMAHVGNAAEAGRVYPMLIVRVRGGTEQSSVNGQVSRTVCWSFPRVPSPASNPSNRTARCRKFSA